MDGPLARPRRHHRLVCYQPNALIRSSLPLPEGAQESGIATNSVPPIQLPLEKRNTIACGLAPPPGLDHTRPAKTKTNPIATKPTALGSGTAPPSSAPLPLPGVPNDERQRL